MSRSIPFVRSVTQPITIPIPTRSASPAPAPSDDLTPTPPSSAPTTLSRPRRPSLKPPQTPRPPRDTSQLRAYHFTPLLPDEELIYETVTTGELTSLSYFPPLRISRAEVMDFRAAHIPGEKVRIVREATKRHLQVFGKGTGEGVEEGFLMSMAGEEQEGVAVLLDLGVKALQRVECFRVGRVDVLRVLDEDTLRRLVGRTNEGDVGASLQELQESFLTNRAWDEHRKHVVAQVISEGRNRKGSISTY
ncbi:hypothetical protein HK097_008434 [Rhizophlyctis rosea]|uniref:Uncharacterized protein n=1 Tax=Rhizophlyctis rosea TaxID=64517 RepID=A0AAD5SKU6_9FUNG|nr:hypothetical protein HK097_008434 [Rhizophlyctis rosea]